MYVYAPAEDSELLREVAVEAISTPSTTVIDVGTGSGYVGHHVRDETGATVVGTDINLAACKAARERDFPVIVGNVTHPIASGAADVVLFNPPYLQTDSREAVNERRAHGDNAAAVRSLFADLDRVLAGGGYALVVWSSNSPEPLSAYTKPHHTTTEIASERLFFETLFVYRVSLDG